MIYKFRAECIGDVLQFMKKAEFRYNLKVMKTSMLPDVVVEVVTQKSLQDIISVFKKIEDSHVMIETVRPKKYYTGVRK